VPCSKPVRNPRRSSHTLHTDHWANRRKIAWWAFISLHTSFLVCLSCALFLSPSDRQIALIENVYEYLALSMGAVIVGYTASDVGAVDRLRILHARQSALVKGRRGQPRSSSCAL
jgi:hypothetical protein